MGLNHRAVRYVLWVLLVVILIGGAGSSAIAQGDDAPLQVVTKPFGPFVIEEADGSWAGFSIELWDVVAQRIGVEYELYGVDTVTEQLADVASNEADIAIAGISITAQREKDIDFTYPYYNAGLRIMTASSESSPPVFGLLTAFLSPAITQLFSIVILLTIVAAHLIYYFERRGNPSYKHGYLRGIGDALWWSAVTVIGYDDDAPRTLVGRVLALIWMFAGIFLIANLTATITAGLTVSELERSINGIADLDNTRVATVSGSTAAEFLQNVGIDFVDVTHIEDAYDLLENETVNAIVYDAPILMYYAREVGAGKVQLVGSVFNAEDYGIALPSGSPLREPINQALLEIIEDGTYDALNVAWFGSNVD